MMSNPGNKTDRSGSEKAEKKASGNPDKRSSFAVLLSTFNGERFVKEQIQSIASQTDVDVTLFIRDDGSSDRTAEIIKEFAGDKSWVHIVFGQNMGVVPSFFWLLEKAGTEYDFYAFADQDDLWLPDKLYRAGELITQKRRESGGSRQSGNSGSGDFGASGETIPHMYFSRLNFVDQSLNSLGHSVIPSTSGFHNALVQNQAAGCTVVLDNAARNLICGNLPSWALMHDWWCYLVVSAFGVVIYDAESRICYRKHDSNVTPATPNFIRELYARTRRFMGENDIPEKVTDQAREFDRLFGDALPDEKRTILQGFLEARGKALPGRLRYSLTMPVRRNTPIDNLIMRFLIVIGRF